MKRALLASVLLVGGLLFLSGSLLAGLLDELPREMVAPDGCVEDCTPTPVCDSSIWDVLDSALTGGRCEALREPVDRSLGASAAVLAVLIFTTGHKTRIAAHIVYTTLLAAAYVTAVQSLTETRDIFGDGEAWYASSDEWEHLTSWLVRLILATTLMLLAVAAGSGSPPRRRKRIEKAPPLQGAEL